MTYPPEEFTALVARARQGDEGALTDLVRRYETGLLLTSNVAFGGPNRSQLFVTGAVTAEATPGAVVRLDLGVPGLPILPAK